MGLGLLQLMATGPQDRFLTGNPKISFFKHIYRNHCNFGIEQYYQEFKGQKTFGKKIKCVLEKKGDLLRNMYIVFEMSSDTYKIPKLGLRLIDYVEIQIGGQLIDKHYGEWMDIWTQLNYSFAKYQLFKTMMKDQYSNTVFKNSSNKIYVPLLFWFNLNPGLALPLVALQYHEVVIYLKIKDLCDLSVQTYTEWDEPILADGLNNPIWYDASGAKNTLSGTEISDMSVLNSESFIDNNSIENTNIPSTTPADHKWHKVDFKGTIKNVYMVCEYIYLDVMEKRLFTSNKIEYLITQVQTTKKLDLPQLTKTISSARIEVPLYFNQPIKELIWAVYPSWLDNLLYYKNMDFTNTLTDIELYANNNRLTEITDFNFFSQVWPHQHYKCGGFINPGFTINLNGGFFTYSFSLNPDGLQPSGSLNFSKLNDFRINFTYHKTDNFFSEIAEPFKILVFGTNYNILKIHKGMGGVLYSN